MVSLMIRKVVDIVTAFLYIKKLHYDRFVLCKAKFSRFLRTHSVVRSHFLLYTLKCNKNNCNNCHVDGKIVTCIHLSALLTGTCNFCSQEKALRHPY